MSELKNYICIDGKRAPITEEQLKALGIEVKKANPFERIKNQNYYFIANDGNICKDLEVYSVNDKLRHNVANYCTDEKLMQQRSLKETLNRLLWRFSMGNGGGKIDWSDKNQAKYYIEYAYDTGLFNIDYFHCIKQQGTECFISKEIAQRAIDEIVKPFMEEHPEFIW